MESREDIFKHFYSTFPSVADGRFHILEHRVPVEQQLEYFIYARRLRKKSRKIKDVEYNRYREKLVNVELPKEEKKKILAILASSSEVRAYRLLEQYVQEPDEELANWASMALMESRIMIESELSGERQIYISSGLGGKEGKMRFYVLIPSTQKTPFKAYQREVIEKEFGYNLSKNDCEIERLTVKDHYVELVFLIPMPVDIRKILEIVIVECNVYGNFLSEIFTVTNVKELTQDEVNQVLKDYRKRFKIR